MGIWRGRKGDFDGGVWGMIGWGMNVMVVVLSVASYESDWNMVIPCL